MDMGASLPSVGIDQNAPHVVARPSNVAIVGFGTVGRSVARILTGGHSTTLQLTHICNRAVDRKKVEWVPPNVCWTERIEDVLAANVDIVVELIGGLQPAEDWVRQALVSGKSVVTANKQLIAREGPALVDLARRVGQQIRFEAAVAGGIPVVRSLQEGLAGDRLVRILGILNGTCNYILTRMEAGGVPFAVALAEAQRRGFAEADPTEDIDGLDAQAKLTILCAVGLGCRLRAADIPCRSISIVQPIDFAYAQHLGCAIRQVSWAERAGPEQRRVRAAVQPALVPLGSSLARIQGSQNVVLVEGEFGGETAFCGFGAGGDPTAVAVVSDLLSIARGDCRLAGVQTAMPSDWTEVSSEFVAQHYIRCRVNDRPGILAALATVLSRHDINIDAVLQEPGHPKDNLPFVMTVEACSTTVLDAALREIAAVDVHVEPPITLPILGRGEPRARAAD